MFQAAMGEVSAREVEDATRVTGDPVRLPAEVCALQKNLIDAHRKGPDVRKAFDDFCAVAFSKPEWAGPSSDFIADEFAEDEETLAALARVPDMIIELSEGHAGLTFIVASHWAAKGETERLNRLAEAMVAAHSRISSPEGVELMLAVCTSIAVVKHPRAEQLLAAARPALAEEHRETLRDAELWLAIGRIVRTATADERRMWDERLRRPRAKWTWDTAEERRALEHLVDHVGVGVEGAQAYRAIVPQVWWDLLVRRSRERMESPELAVAPQRQAERVPLKPPTDHSAEDVEHRSRKVVFPFMLGAVAGAATVLIVGWLFPGARGSSPGKGADLVAVEPSTPSWRQARISEYERELGDLASVLEEVKGGAWEDHSTLLMGYTSRLPADSGRYRLFLEWLQLDPPKDPTTREMVGKLLVHRFPGNDLLDLWEGIILDEAPHSGEVREAAREALAGIDEGKGTWSERDVLRLKKMAGG